MNIPGAWACGGIGGLLHLNQGAPYSYLYDGKGNVTMLLDANANEAATYQYDPFGKVRNVTGSVTQPLQFSTKPYDEKTGLSYYGYRFYVPALGRWLTRDPIGEVDGPNLYAYVKNNPVNYIDPWGLLCEDADDLPSDSSECAKYGLGIYANASMSCFCKCAGDSPWARKVRGCLRCMAEKRVPMCKAHIDCYVRAENAGLPTPWFSVVAPCLASCGVGEWPNFFH